MNSAAARTPQQATAPESQDPTHHPPQGTERGHAMKAHKAGCNVASPLPPDAEGTIGSPTRNDGLQRPTKRPKQPDCRKESPPTHRRTWKP